jgi:hypothetical protein
MLRAAPDDPGESKVLSLEARGRGRDGNDRNNGKNVGLGQMGTVGRIGPAFAQGYGAAEQRRYCPGNPPAGARACTPEAGALPKTAARSSNRDRIQTFDN